MPSIRDGLAPMDADSDGGAAASVPHGGVVLPLAKPASAGAAGGSGTAATTGADVTVPMTVAEGQLLSFTIPASVYGGLINPTITWQTANGTATSGLDYVANGGSTFTIQVQ